LVSQRHWSSRNSEPHVTRRRWAEVAFGERLAGPGLQVPLERECARFVRKVNEQVNVPWSSVGGVGTLTRVMRIEPRAPVAGHSGGAAPFI
jgi:hypothetical protein